MSIQTTAPMMGKAFRFGIQYWRAGLVLALLLFQNVAIMNTEQNYKIKANDFRKIRNLNILLKSVPIKYKNISKCQLLYPKYAA